MRRKIKYTRGILDTTWRLDKPKTRIAWVIQLYHPFAWKPKYGRGVEVNASTAGRIEWGEYSIIVGFKFLGFGAGVQYTRAGFLTQ